MERVTSNTWVEQSEKMVATWTESQKKLWDNWLGAMGTLSTNDTFEKMEAERQKALENWQNSIKKGLEAQTEWANIWSQNLSSQHTPQPTLDWAAQMTGMMKSWTESQEKLMSVWFEMAKNMDGVTASENFEKQAKEALTMWQEAANNALKAQEEMAKLWQVMKEKA